jgi:poly-gamma-glutamate synthesis protein (capsule biosynthesis protein)
MVTKRLSRIDDGRFARLRTLVDDADASIVNLEAPVHDFDFAPSQRRSTHFHSPAWALDDLDWLGFDLVSAANNHVGDYGQGAMANTMAALGNRDIPYAGIGDTLAHARSPTFFEASPGRVALLAATTTFVPGTEAAQQRRDVPGRAGIAPLRMEPRYELTPENYRALDEIRENLAMGAVLENRGSYVDRPTDGGVVPFVDVGSGTAGRTLRFTEGSENRIRYEIDESDKADVLEYVETAAGRADTVVFSLHSHEGSGGTYNQETVPPAIETFARECVDAGVDLFFCHGPHRIRGIEVYERAPIFYSLGNLVLHYGDVSLFPATDYRSRGLDADAHPHAVHERLGNVVSPDGWNDGIVPVCTVHADGVADVTIHPVELGTDRTHATNGTGFLAPTDAANGLLEHLAALSASYGTDVDVDSGTGTVALP